MTTNADRPLATGWVGRRIGGMPRGFWVVFTGMGLARIGWFIVPFRIVYLSGQRQLDPGECSFVMTAFGAGWALSQPVGGLVAERLGGKATMVAGAWSIAAAFLAFGSAQTLGGLALAAAVMGLSFELHRPAAQAMTADETSALCCPRALALLYLAMNVGRGIGCVLAGLLAGNAFWVLFVTYAMLNIGFGAIALATCQDGLIQPEARLTHGLRLAVKDYRLVFFTAITICFYMILLQSVVTLPAIIGRSGSTPIALGFILCLGPFAVAVSQVVLQRWLTPDDPNAIRRCRTALLVCAMGIPTVGIGIGLAIAGGASSLLWVAGTSPIWVVGEVAFLAVAPAVVAHIAPPPFRATYFGVWGGCQGVAAMLAPTISDMLVRSGGTELLWHSTATAAMFSGLACLFLRNQTLPRNRTLPHTELASSRSRG